ncbi:fur4 [Acrasis kona]|uniref:Fur4 n=1 Tax=Acrasis kona TaxID=1008807 RepID=A0AAW2Z5F8_9EUKA
MNAYDFNMTIDEDVENNYEQDRIPDILNPYLDLPTQKKVEKSDMLSYESYVSSRNTRVLKKNLSLKKKPTLFITC